METYRKLMLDHDEMMNKFEGYLISRISHCQVTLVKACIRFRDKLEISEDGIYWEDGHFSFNAMTSMMHMFDMKYDKWDDVIRDPHYPMCINQVVKEIVRLNRPYSDFLAFFEESVAIQFRK
jgi:hypothetical protein